VRGRAATAFWNVDGLVKFACAQDGAVLYFDEFAFDEERRGLPDELVPLVDLVAVDLEDEEGGPKGQTTYPRITESSSGSWVLRATW
jgi:hypothetical protein